MTAFWDIALCSLLEVTNGSEVRTASIIRAINNRPDVGGSTHL
jgi:hypothetical protein